MKNSQITIIFIFLIFSIICSQNLPVNLKGQVITYNSYAQRDVPVRYVNIDLYLLDPVHNQWVHYRSSNTNINGYYFIYNIVPGRYKVVVKNGVSLIIDVNPVQYQNQFQQVPNIRI
jgi:hypothetical protein